jgi:ectoine hydroxylase-related dioxygenase (phytanoyl-CoA dioxygenase family)
MNNVLMDEQSQTLPNLASEYQVSPAQRDFFAANGYLYLPQVATTEEVGQYRPQIKQAVAEMNRANPLKPLAERDTYGKAFIQTMNVWRHDEAVKKFVLAKRFAHLAASLLGVDKVRLYHDQALFKEPGGGPTPWHQDQYYWPLDNDRTVTLWMPMIDITDEMGILTFAGGSHRQGMLESLAISDESQAALDSYVQGQGFPVWRPSGMKAGDATFHQGWTLHFAPGNVSGLMREVMTIIYFADGTRVAQPSNANQENDRQTWLQGYAPGTLADSELNPAIG